MKKIANLLLGTLTFIITSCSVQEAVNLAQLKNELIPERVNPTNEFSLHKDSTALLSVENQFRIYVPKNAFETLDGQELKSSNITLRVKVVRTKKEMILNSISTVTDDNQLLVSGGMIKLEALVNNETLKLKDKSNIRIEFMTKEKDNKMMVFYADEPKEDGQVIWKNNGIKPCPCMVRLPLPALPIKNDMFEIQSQNLPYDYYLQLKDIDWFASITTGITSSHYFYTREFAQRFKVVMEFDAANHLTIQSTPLRRFKTIKEYDCFILDTLPVINAMQRASRLFNETTNAFTEFEKECYADLPCEFDNILQEKLVLELTNNEKKRIKIIEENWSKRSGDTRGGVDVPSPFYTIENGKLQWMNLDFFYWGDSLQDIQINIFTKSKDKNEVYFVHQSANTVVKAETQDGQSFIINQKIMIGEHYTVVLIHYEENKLFVSIKEIRAGKEQNINLELEPRQVTIEELVNILDNLN